MASGTNMFTVTRTPGRTQLKEDSLRLAPGAGPLCLRGHHHPPVSTSPSAEVYLPVHPTTLAHSVPASFSLCAGAAHDAMTSRSFRVMYPKRKRKGTPSSRTARGFRLRIGFSASVSPTRAEDDRVGWEEPSNPIVQRARPENGGRRSDTYGILGVVVFCSSAF